MLTTTTGVVGIIGTAVVAAEEAVVAEEQTTTTQPTTRKKMENDAAASSSAGEEIIKEQVKIVEVNVRGETTTTSSSSTSSSSTQSPSQTQPDSNSNCGIWLATSTLGDGKTGLGLFAGRNYAPNEFIYNDLVIPISDLTSAKFDYFLFDEYTWNAKALKLDVPNGYTEINVFSPGFGSTANSLLPIYNVDEYTPIRTTTATSATTSAEETPGNTAHTDHHVRPSKTRNFEILPGQEFFVSYGKEWFTARSQHLGPIPTSRRDYKQASRMLRKFHELSMINNNTSSSTTINNNNNTTTTTPGRSLVADDLWKTFVQNTAFVDSRVLKGSFDNNMDKDNHNPWQLQDKYDNNVTKARIADSILPMSELESMGTCADYIIGRPSSLPEAGYGAFARVNLPTGTVVAALAMIHIPNSTILDMQQLDKQGNIINETTTTIIYPGGTSSSQQQKRKQLLLNYCYGHHDSTLLLCPYSPGVNYVNHGNPSQANVMLRWSLKHNNKDWLNMSIDKFSSSSSQLVMEFVSTRNIAKDEEILFNYGHSWERAWQSYVSTFQPREDYRSASQIDVDQEPLRTVFEEYQNQTIPDNIKLYCDITFYQDDKHKWKEHLEKDLAEYLYENDADWWPCEILRYRHDDERYWYTVHMFERNADTGILNSNLVVDIPKEAFHYVDEPYTLPIYRPTAFRHYIEIPDDIFPQIWRNNNKKKQAYDDDDDDVRASSQL